MVIVYPTVVQFQRKKMEKFYFFSKTILSLADTVYLTCIKLSIFTYTSTTLLFNARRLANIAMPVKGVSHNLLLTCEYSHRLFNLSFVVIRLYSAITYG
jgi:hypothetical protein